jgi:hypothetical protein
MISSDEITTNRPIVIYQYYYRCRRAPLLYFKSIEAKPPGVKPFYAEPFLALRETIFNISVTPITRIFEL